MLESNTLYLHIIYGRSLDSYLFRSFLIPYDLDLVRQLNVFLVIVLREIPPLPDYTNIYLTSWSMLYIEQWTALCHSSLNILAIIQTSACLTRGICMSTRIQHYTDVTWTTWCIKSPTAEQFTRLFISTPDKISKLCITGLFLVESAWIQFTRSANNAEIISMSWRHQG